ncbi:unnamed protein product [Protopolystoma xenopodis]|uniref:Protein transport protein SEC23 n=1 Tax=Protopolystoma xenopodis TaxID=117903 RepID=A0A3S5BYU7_9PLAT|nr:unnamed protein product [Protopolystoma xenopodis]
MANRAAQNLHIIDLFSCSLDQTGLHEMRYLANYTGGHIVMGDSFASSLFQQTFRRVFACDANGFLKSAFAGTLEVKTTRELKVSGCIGPCFSANMKTSNTGDLEIGVGRTSVWRINGMTPNTTLGIYFEVANSGTSGSSNQSGCSGMPAGGRGYVQFITQYQHGSGQRRIRVTTACRNWVDSSSMGGQLPHLIASFDQEAATVMMARIAMFKAETSDCVDVLRSAYASFI